MFNYFKYLKDRLRFFFWKFDWMGYLLRLKGPCSVLIVSMFICVGQTTLDVLFVLTVYLSWKRRFKELLFIWGFFIVTWYFAFTSLIIGFEGSIWLGNLGGEESTWDLLSYIDFVYAKYPSLQTFCVGSVAYLHFLGIMLGIPIYIVSPFKGILMVIKYLQSF